MLKIAVFAPMPRAVQGLRPRSPRTRPYNFRVPAGTPFHERTFALCASLNYRDWSGYYTVSSYETHHEHEYNAIRNAAALIEPDSAAAMHARLRDRYPRSPWAVALDGGNPADLPAWEVSEAALRVAWTDVALQFADSLAKQRATNAPANTKRPVRTVKKPAPKAPAQGAIP